MTIEQMKWELEAVNNPPGELSKFAIQEIRNFLRNLFAKDDEE